MKTVDYRVTKTVQGYVKLDINFGDGYKTVYHGDYDKTVEFHCHHIRKCLENATLADKDIREEILVHSSDLTNGV